ncbi:MAG: hypothetical protein JWM62_2465 [Frankiales bacterium]|nr:hypothetical protein [Frankiales bacterium]
MRALWLVPALAVTLTACSGSPQDELRADVQAVTLAANDGSAPALRDAVEELLATIRAQIGSNELDRAEGDRLRAIALRIQEQAALLEQPSPSPTPEPTEEEPEPEPTEEEPEPEPTQEEPEPEPTEEEPEPEPTEEEPEPEPSVEVVVPIQESPPTAQSQTGPGSSAAPSPAA